MDYLNLLVDTKKEFTILLINDLTPEIKKGIYSIYNNCKNKTNDKQNILFLFQKILSEVPNWNSIIINSETNRIKNRISYLEDLITAVFVSNMRLLCSIKNKDKEIKVKVPKLENFIHKCYIEVAKEFWESTYLFNENLNALEIQKNKKQIDFYIKNSIENVIRKLLPIKTILKDYLETNFDTETTVENNSLIDIIKSNETVQKITETNLNKYNNEEDNEENNEDQKKNENEENNEKEFSNNEMTQKKESDFVFDENLFLNTITNDIIDKPNELYNNEIKVVNLNSEENI